MKEHVKILVLGDPGVGKSSLISSYVSRYFSNDIPSVVADCFLRPDTTASDIYVTIMDSSSRIGDRNVLIQKIRVSDSIIACYDSTRLETIDNLATIWLPLIQAERENHAKVVVAGTKIDLLSDMEGVIPAEEQRRVQELLMSFPFCLLAERSSSKMINVDQLFFRAEQVITYPIHPVFNIREKNFTVDGLRAILHIFRIYDWDNDNLLSDVEINRLQSECFNSYFNHDELVELKKQLMKITSNSISQNKVTLEGLVASIKRLIIPCQCVTQLWAMLRCFDYEDDLSLQLPSDLEWVRGKSDSTRLSLDAIEFLNKLYVNAVYHVKSSDPRSTSDCYPPYNIEQYLGNRIIMEGKSDAETTYFKAIAFIFSVIMPDVITPWNTFPIYEDTDEPLAVTLSNKQADMKHKFLFSSPSTSPASSNADNWLLYWHILAAHRPTVTQIMLYRLGYVNRSHDNGIISTVPIVTATTKVPNPKPIIRICILGRNGIGKRSFVWALSTMPAIHREPILTHPYDTISSNNDNNTNISESKSSISPSHENEESTSSFSLHDDLELVTGGCVLSSTSHLMSSASSTSGMNSYLLATAVPYDISKDWIESEAHSYDVAILLFRSDWQESIQDAITIETYLPPILPRIFVSMKADITSQVPPTSSASSPAADEVSSYLQLPTHSLDTAIAHSREEDLYDVLQLSMMNSKTVEDTIPTLLALVQDPSRGIPIHLRGLRETKPWSWTMVTVSVCSTITIAAGAYYLFRKSRSDHYDSNSILTKLSTSVRSIIYGWTKRIRKIV